MNRQIPPSHLLMPMQKRIESILSHQNALSIKDLAVNGKMLIENGIPAGKQMGIIMQELLETVLEDPLSNTKEKLLPVANNLYKKLSD